MFTFKLLNSLAAQYLVELCTSCSEGDGLRLRSSDYNWQIPLFRTSIGQSAYCYCGEKL